MKKFLSVIVFVFMLSGQALALEAVDSINNFAFSAGKILGRNGGSYFFSPFSIISAFGMAYSGASRDTAKEIESVLGFSPELHVSLGELAREFGRDEQISSANRVWLKKGLTLRDDFKNDLFLSYNSKVPEIDFKSNPQKARQEINDWISKQTHGKIENLIQELDPETRMILTNAIYFSAEWNKKFKKDKTESKPFWYDGKNYVEVPMMMQENDFDYAEADGVKIIRLQYKGRKFSMIIVLPPENKDIELSAESFSGWLDAMNTYEVDLWLPKFKAEERYQLKELFNALGINIAFTNDADFSGITEDEPLKIDEVIHQTFIDVDEEKTEAAAATAMMMFMATAAPMRRPRAEFHADRPFTYFIIDNRNKTILFMGHKTFEQ